MNKEPTKTRNISEKEDHHIFAPSTSLQPFGSRTLSKLVIPRPTKLLGHYIYSGQLGMVFGWRGIGKSTFVMAMALSMATGKSFLNATPEKKSKVIILDGEMDVYTIQNRLKMISESLDVSLTNRLGITSPEFYSGVMPKLHTPEGQKRIDDELGTDWDVLIVDNYSCFSSGREDAEAWAPWLPWLLSHKRAGRTVIIVHHTGKNGTQRGASNHEDPMVSVPAEF